MKRKNFISRLGLISIHFWLYPILGSCSKSTPGEDRIEEPSSSFNKLDDASIGEVNTSNFELNISQNTATLGKYTMEAYLTNGLLGCPTIRANRGDYMTINFLNNTDAQSILHWHGLIVPPEMDGHPHLAIPPGENYPYAYLIDQRAGTYFYHAHTHGLTGKQVYMGIAGFYLVSDAEEKALSLPSGAFEIPLLIQDKRTSGDSIQYNPSPMEYNMMGFLGDTIFINHLPNAAKTVKKTSYRLRVLNGSNARIYNLAFENHMPFTIIGTDGGLLEEPVTLTEVLISPAERLDIIVDFSKLSISQVALLSTTPNATLTSGMGMGMGMQSGGPDQGAPFTLLTFNIENDKATPTYNIPSVLSSIDYPDESSATLSREISLDMLMQAGHAINNRQFDMESVEYEIPRGSVEIWEFTNNSSMAHPMHIHGVQFRILSRTGRGVQEWEKGLKDTVLVLPGEVVRILIHFTVLPGLYLFHCHNLEHEDRGMMLNFRIT